jgi:hypothetical protein
MAIISNFQIGATILSFKKPPNCTHAAERTPFQTHHPSENLATPGIEPGPPDAARNSDQ